MRLWEKIATLYIKETTVDGQRFCGCREEDCELHGNLKECCKCLKAQVEEDFTDNSKTA